MARIYKVERPNNPDLPYFAYDAFKPGQVAFPVIRHFVRDIRKCEVNCSLKQRNGVPILVDDRYRNRIPTKGFLIYFNDNVVHSGDDALDAYDYICDAKSISLYEWKEIDLGFTRANVLFAKKAYFGKDFSENDGDYQGKRDRGFYGPLEYIHDHLDEVGDYYTPNDFFKLHMFYMLLWSAIDKYLSLCYGGWDQRKTVNEWAKWEEFQSAFDEHVDRKDTAYSSQGSRAFKLNSYNPIWAANYYYQIRCNVVHSGKSNYEDFNKLKQSLCELLGIFWDVLDDSFDAYDF